MYGAPVDVAAANRERHALGGATHAETNPVTSPTDTHRRRSDFQDVTRSVERTCFDARCATATRRPPVTGWRCNSNIEVACATATRRPREKTEQQHGGLQTPLRLGVATKFTAQSTQKVAYEVRTKPVDRN